MDGFVGTESSDITIKGEEDDSLTFEYRQNWDGGGAGLKGPKMSRIKRTTTSTPTLAVCYWFTVPVTGAGAVTKKIMGNVATGRMRRNKIMTENREY